MTARKRADQALLALGLFESRAKAQEAIAAGLVTVDGNPVKKPSEMIDPKAHILAQKPYPWVSRGGVKLDHALNYFSIDPTGHNCLDVGASTGGFSHVLLERGAAQIVAVDVGHDQLHPSLCQHPRLKLLEGQDIRTVTRQQLPFLPSLIVVDVSFISLMLLVSPIRDLAADDADLILLIKPQFEAGKTHISKNGIVKDPMVQEAICEQIRDKIISLDWNFVGLIPSPITGGDGNQEFLLYATRKKVSIAC
jgi:23S rRNA (cytidine1920-2'-O)/16S rRNA (cytidine1409-2'-O)-methyltransferase